MVLQNIHIHAVEGTAVFGAIGNGKTSGSMAEWFGAALLSQNLSSYYATLGGERGTHPLESLLDKASSAPRDMDDCYADEGPQGPHTILNRRNRMVVKRDAIMCSMGQRRTPAVICPEEIRREVDVSLQAVFRQPPVQLKSLQPSRATEAPSRTRGWAAADVQFSNPAMLTPWSGLFVWEILVGQGDLAMSGHCVGRRKKNSTCVPQTEPIEQGV